MWTIQRITLTDLIIICLAAYRLAYMFVYEDGPFDIVLMFRRSMVRMMELRRNKFTVSIVKGINCVYCLGVWMAAMCCAAILWGNPIAYVIVLVFAAAGGQSFIQQMSDK